MKVTRGVNFININVLYERRFFMYMHLEKSCRNDVSYEKFVHKLLMKLTGGGKLTIFCKLSYKLGIEEQENCVQACTRIVINNKVEI